MYIDRGGRPDLLCLLLFQGLDFYGNYSFRYLRQKLQEAVALEKPGLSKEELSQLEESILKRIVRRKDGQEPTI